MKRGRPRRWKGYRITSFYIPDEMVPIYEKLREMAFAEGVPINDKILEAIYEYVEKKSPELSSKEPEEVKLVREAREIEASAIANELKEVVSTLTAQNVRLDVRVSMAKRTVPKLVTRLAKLNAFLKNEEYSKLCRTAVRLMEQVTNEWLNSR